MYVNPDHKKLPHIVKFSGGRSSGYMVLKLIKKGMLDKKRGDAVIFNNTSAEHPKTYEFVKKVKKEVESAGIPFFILEFQTYEDLKRGIYNRYKSYRLAGDEEFSEHNPDGYKKNLEVFEEFISFLGYVPNFYGGRICTKILKKEVTDEFIKEWFDFLEFGINIQRKGHYGTEILADFEKIHKTHIKKGGSVPFDVFKKKKEYCYLKCPHIRKAQNFGDFTPINPASADSLTDEYVSLIGFRADEDYRLQRIKKRLKLDEKIKSYVKEGNEHIYMPLVEWGADRDEIVSFWKNYKFDLELPGELYGNCVYCFMKAKEKLLKIKPSKESKAVDLDSWIELEKKYQRDLAAEGRERKNGAKIINFFGSNGELSYEIIADRIKNGD